MTQENENQKEKQGYFPMPRKLREDCIHVYWNTFKLVTFLADATMGWEQTRWVLLTYPEILEGRKRRDGSHFEAGSGLGNDASVRRAIADALEKRFIEIRQIGGQTAYAIHKRYWRVCGLTPNWAFYKKVRYDPVDDPLDETESAFTMKAQQYQETPPALTIEASTHHHESNEASQREQAQITMISQNPDETSTEEASREEKERGGEEREEKRKEEKESVAVSLVENEEDETRLPESTPTLQAPTEQPEPTYQYATDEALPPMAEIAKQARDDKAWWLWRDLCVKRKGQVTSGFYENVYGGSEGFAFEGATLVVHVHSTAQAGRLKADRAAMLSLAARQIDALRFEYVPRLPGIEEEQVPYQVARPRLHILHNESA